MNSTNLVYVVTAKVNGMQIPIRTQVKYARDYCNANNISFTLPKTEYWNDYNYSLLKQISESKADNILLYSAILIAEERPLKILQSNISAENFSGTKFHVTFTDETYTYKELLDIIKSKIINKKFSMQYLYLKQKLALQS